MQRESAAADLDGNDHSAAFAALFSLGGALSNAA
jgi:hypothetical protein